MKIPMLDMRAELAPLRAEIDAAIARVLDHGSFILGREVADFERALAKTLGVRRAIGVSSGTDALLVALMALGIGPGDEVVTTPFSFFATAGVVARLGAVPVFADIDPDTFQLSVSAAQAAAGPRTRAVIPVHLFGLPAPPPELDGVPVLEDAAQSIAAAPLRGAAAALSFFPAKNLGCLGDGGAVLTDDEALADRVATLRVHGARPKYYHRMIGGNFRLDALQAAVLSAKLPHLPAAIERRQRAAAVYRQLFADRELPITLPADAPEHTYNQFVIRTPRRDELRDYLTAREIATAVYYPVPLHLQACFASLGYRDGQLPESERAAREVLALPISPTITPEQQVAVVDAIAAFSAAGAA